MGIKRLVLFIALFIPSFVAAQAVRIDGVAQARSGAPAPGITIAVCSQPAVTTTQPCSPLATLYTNGGAGTACSGTLSPPAPAPGGVCSNPMLSDGLGNYHFYSLPGTYTVQFYGAGITPFVEYDQTLPGSIVNPTGQNIAFTGPFSASGVKNFDNIRFVDGANAAGWAGADIGAWINSADSNLGNTPGEIWVTGYNGFSTAAQVVITNGHILRFIQGGTLGWTAGGIILTSGSMIKGSGGIATISSAPAGTVLQHNFNGDFITMNGAPLGAGGNQGGGGIEDVTITNTYSGGDCSGNAIVMSPQATTGSISFPLIRRTYVDGSNASFRWTRGLYATDLNRNGFMRTPYIEDSRFSSSCTNNEDMRFEGIQNGHLLSVRSDNSNNGAQTVGWTFTGAGGASATSAAFIIQGGNSGTVVFDRVSNFDLEGGEFSAITTTANMTGANTLRPGFVTSGPIANNSASTTLIVDPSLPGQQLINGQLKITALTNSTGLQLFNSSTTCTTGASIGAICTTAAISLPVSYADTNYRLSCIGQGPTNVPIVQTYTKSNSTFTITIAALTAAAAAFSSYDCTAGHN